MLCAYEQERLNNIADNQRKLAELGLLDQQVQNIFSKEKKKKKRRSSSDVPKSLMEKTRILPTRGVAKHAKEDRDFFARQYATLDDLDPDDDCDDRKPRSKHSKRESRPITRFEDIIFDKPIKKREIRRPSPTPKRRWADYDDDEDLPPVADLPWKHAVTIPVKTTDPTTTLCLPLPTIGPKPFVTMQPSISHWSSFIEIHFHTGFTHVQLRASNFPDNVVAAFEDFCNANADIRFNALVSKYNRCDIRAVADAKTQCKRIKEITNDCTDLEEDKLNEFESIICANPSLSEEYDNEVKSFKGRPLFLQPYSPNQPFRNNPMVLCPHGCGGYYSLCRSTDDVRKHTCSR